VTLVEGKSVLAAMLTRLVQAQAGEYCDDRRICSHCGSPRAVKDWRSRRLTTLFGSCKSSPSLQSLPLWARLVPNCQPSNGIIRARRRSTPARPYMARLSVFNLLIGPPFGHCSRVPTRHCGRPRCLAVRSWQNAAYHRFRICVRRSARCPDARPFRREAVSEAHRQMTHRGELHRRRLQRIDVDDLPGGHWATRLDAERRRGQRRDLTTRHRVQGSHVRRRQGFLVRRSRFTRFS